MYAVARSYSGPGAHELFDVIEDRKSDVEKVLSTVNGLISYCNFRTSDGGVTVTVCEDKQGTDESTRVARDWIMENAPDIQAPPPMVSEGTVLVTLT